jgi:hypothetical protein
MSRMNVAALRALGARQDRDGRLESIALRLEALDPRYNKVLILAAIADAMSGLLDRETLRVLAGELRRIKIAREVFIADLKRAACLDS